MIVAHIISSLKRGGRERQLSIICKYSTQVQNIIIYYNESDSDYIKEYQLENKAICVAERGFTRRISKTIRICKEYKIDCIITWATMETVIGIIVSQFLMIPLINFSIRHGIRKKNFLHLFRTFLLHISKNVVANSVAGLRANNLSKGIVIYNGMENIPEFVSCEDKTALKRKQLGLSDIIVFISVANLVPYKDYFTILKALNEIKRQNLGFYFIIVGEGPNRKKIESMIMEYNLKDDILMTGSISNVNDYLKVADIMIHSSMGEGCSNAILEGMKHGLPVIATDVGGTPEILDQRNALLFEYGDAQSLQKHIEYLLNNPSLASQMGRISHLMATQRFSVERMITDYERTVITVTSGKKQLINDLIKIVR